MVIDRRSNIWLSIVSLVLSFSLHANTTPISLSQISKVRLLSHNNLPIKLMVYLENQDIYSSEYGQFRNSNQKFVNELAKIVMNINAHEEKLNRDALKLLILDSTDDPKLNFLTISEEQKNLYIKRIPFVGDVWLQDFGEIMMAQTSQDTKEHLLLLDLNRGRGLKDLAQNLSYFWNSYYFKANIRSRAGNYGGNLEVTPNNIIYMGTTAQQELADFFLSHGYQDNFVRLNTNWLFVGHVDEFISTIILPDDPCGFGIVKASPLKALEILQMAQNQDFASIPADYDHLYHYSEELQSIKTYLVHPSASTESESFVRAQRRAARIIDNNVSTLVAAIIQKTPRCQNIKIVEYPNLYQCDVGPGNQVTSCLAYLPGPINMLVLKNHLVIPDPLFGPFRNYLQEKLIALQQIPHFIDSMFYHVISGGIHCGTNVFRLPNNYVYPLL